MRAALVGVIVSALGCGPGPRPATGGASTTIRVDATVLERVGWFPADAKLVSCATVGRDAATPLPQECAEDLQQTATAMCWIGEFSGWPYDPVALAVVYGAHDPAKLRECLRASAGAGDTTSEDGDYLRVEVPESMVASSAPDPGATTTTFYIEPAGKFVAMTYYPTSQPGPALADLLAGKRRMSRDPASLARLHHVVGNDWRLTVGDVTGRVLGVPSIAAVESGAAQVGGEPTSPLEPFRDCQTPVRAYAEVPVWDTCLPASVTRVGERRRQVFQFASDSDATAALAERQRMARYEHTSDTTARLDGRFVVVDTVGVANKQLAAITGPTDSSAGVSRDVLDALGWFPASVTEVSCGAYYGDDLVIELKKLGARDACLGEIEHPVRRSCTARVGDDAVVTVRYGPFPARKIGTCLDLGRVAKRNGRFSLVEPRKPDAMRVELYVAPAGEFVAMLRAPMKSSAPTLADFLAPATTLADLPRARALLARAGGGFAMLQFTDTVGARIGVPAIGAVVAGQDDYCWEFASADDARAAGKAIDRRKRYGENGKAVTIRVDDRFVCVNLAPAR